MPTVDPLFFTDDAALCGIGNIILLAVVAPQAVPGAVVVARKGWMPFYVSWATGVPPQSRPVTISEAALAKRVVLGAVLCAWGRRRWALSDFSTLPWEHWSPQWVRGTCLQAVEKAKALGVLSEIESVLVERHVAACADAFLTLYADRTAEWASDTCLGTALLTCLLDVFSEEEATAYLSVIFQESP